MTEEQGFLAGLAFIAVVVGLLNTRWGPKRSRPLMRCSVCREVRSDVDGDPPRCEACYGAEW